MTKRKFITPAERHRRVKVLMDRNEWSWYRLAKEMRMERTAVVRTLKTDTNGEVVNDPSLKTLKALARALGVSVGFFVDQEVKR